MEWTEYSVNKEMTNLSYLDSSSVKKQPDGKDRPYLLLGETPFGQGGMYPDRVESFVYPRVRVRQRHGKREDTVEKKGRRQWVTVGSRGRTTGALRGEDPLIKYVDFTLKFRSTRKRATMGSN